MRDFPPDIRASTDRAESPADEPDTRSPRAFLWWMVRQQGSLFWFGLLVALIWMVPQTVGPWIVGRACLHDNRFGGDWPEWADAVKLRAGHRSALPANHGRWLC